MASDASTIRLPFRVVAAVLGPAAILAGIVITGATVGAFVEDGWYEWRTFGSVLLFMVFCAVASGLVFTRAAWTGRDPFVRRPAEGLERIP